MGRANAEIFPPHGKGAIIGRKTRETGGMRLIADELRARRGGEVVFAGVSFALDAGEALVVTGPNGIGKSTLLRVVAGLLPAESGTLSLQGGDPQARPAEQMHYLGHHNAMKRELTVRENLEFWQRLMSGATTGGTPTVPEAADAVGLSAITHLPFGVLSAGQQRRIAMARLLLVHRPVWLLDEPTAALDTASEALFANLVADHCAKGGLLIAATHRPLGLSRPKRLELEAFRPAFAEDAE